MVLGDYVTVEDGTGLVHQAPAFGADDMQVCRAYGLPVVNPVRNDGTFEEHLDLVGGEFFKTADAALVADLKDRGLLFKHLDYEHSYPHCWRCHTPLMYYAVPSWYIKTTAIKDQLLAENAETNWSWRTSRTDVTGSGCATTSTGRCPAAATGAHRCRSGSSRTVGGSVWAP